VAIKVVRAIKRYVKSARIEAKILDYIFDKQKELNVNLCVKMYSHFKLYGEGGIWHWTCDDDGDDYDYDDYDVMTLMMIVVGCMFILINGYVFTMTRMFNDNVFFICCIIFHRSLLPSVPVIGAVPV
jgi:hypothetical protein